MIGMAPSAEAVTYAAQIINQCGNLGESGAEAVSVSCGNAFASASPGSLSVYTQAFAVSASSGFTSDGFVRAGAQFIDTLTFGGLQSGSISIPLDYAGSIEFDGNVPEGAAILQRGSVSGGLGNDSVFNATVSFDTWNGIISSGSLSGITDYVLEIVDGKASVWAGLGASSECQIWGAAGLFISCSSIVDYGASLRFLGATVFDDQGNRRDDVIITSESGFDYRKGVEPHDPGVGQPEVIPLPATGLLLIGGLAAFAAIRRKSRA